MNRNKTNTTKSAGARAVAGRRNTNRTTILTTDKASYAVVTKLNEGEIAGIECPNDIISSGRNELGNNHHSIRRVTLLRRAVNGNHRRVRVRYRQGLEVYCTVVGDIAGGEDDASFFVRVTKPFVNKA